MATKLGEAFVLITARSKLGKQMQQEKSKVQSAFSGVVKMGVAAGAALAAAFTFQKIFGGLKKSFDLFARQELAMTRVEAVVKATGGAAGFTAKQIQQQAAELQKVTRFGDESLLEAQGILLTFKKIQGLEFKRTTKAMADIAEVMGTDVKSGAVQLGKALNDPIRGVSMLSRTGITFSQVQRDQIKNMVKQNNLLGAQRLILTEVESQFGGTAEAMAKTSAGQITQAWNRFGDIMERIGASVAPLFLKFAEFAEWLLDKLQPAITYVIGIIGESLKMAMPYWKELFGVIMSIGKIIWTVLKPALAVMFAQFKVWVKVLTVGLKMVGGILEALARMIEITIKPIIDAAIWVAKKLGIISDEALKTTKSMKSLEATSTKGLKKMKAASEKYIEKLKAMKEEGKALSENQKINYRREKKNLENINAILKKREEWAKRREKRLAEEAEKEKRKVAFMEPARKELKELSEARAKAEQMTLVEMDKQVESLKKQRDAIIKREEERRKEDIGIEMGLGAKAVTQKIQAQLSGVKSKEERFQNNLLDIEKKLLEATIRFEERQEELNTWARGGGKFAGALS